MAVSRHDRSSPRGIERLARELASTAQLSFDERRTFFFIREVASGLSRIRSAYRTLSGRLANRSFATQGVESLLDNFYVVDNALSEIVEHWKEKETLRIPQTTDEDGALRPRVYVLARALVRHADALVERENVVAFLESYQRVAPLSVRELGIFPDMLRYALVEDMLRLTETTLSNLKEIEEADRWFARIMRIAGKRKAPRLLTELTSELAKTYKIVPLYFGFHLLTRINQSGKEKDLRVITKWLKLTLARQGVGPAHLSESMARNEQARARTIQNAIAGLRWLAQVRWEPLALELNPAHATLMRDPAGAYPSLTEETRTEYLRAIVRIADRTGIHDVEAAREAVRLAKLSSGRKAHVGYYLVDKGRDELEATFGYRYTAAERLRRRITERPTAYYLGFIGTVTLIAVVLFFAHVPFTEKSSLGSFITFIAATILASEIAVALAHFVFTRTLLPKPLPALDLFDGVGDGRRTIVVMPSMFRNKESAKKLLARMETNYVGNKDENIYFAALMDFRDADREETIEDALRVKELEEGIRDLNERHPSAVPRFAFFYRRRTWNKREGKWMGWERKRGKLREFNLLLRGKPTSYEGDAAESMKRYGRVKYVLTVDEDTELVRDSAALLVGTIDHPLNRPVVDKTRNVVTEGYGIVEPASALRFREGGRSIFAALFGGFPGIEAYSSLTSNLNQDLFGEAIFHGKGVYDVDVLEATMDDHIPENTVLSHDLLEGLYARVGMASGAHIFEGFPSNYREHMERFHRWVRGDWQIIEWLFPKRGGVFSAIGRWRIFDNLRRSLVPLAAASLVISAMIGRLPSAPVTFFVFLTLAAPQIIPAIVRIAETATTWKRRLSLKHRIETIVVEFGIATAKTFLLGIFALHNAVITLDAILRSMWRLFISHKKLLEWQTAYESAARAKGGVPGFVRFMWRSIIIAALLVFAGLRVIPPEALLALWPLAWMTAPVFAAFISYKLPERTIVGRREMEYLYTIAARTFWYFSDMATKEEQWLAPDHFQEEPVAKRHSHGLGVSPTNLGMYLVSLSAARALGLASVGFYSDRLAKAFTTMSRMERFRGHFYNWHELRTLAPLLPRYISSVDSANLALALLSVRSAAKEAIAAPVISRAMFEGLSAMLEVLEGVTRVALARRSDRNERKYLGEILEATLESRALFTPERLASVTPRDAEFIFSGVVHHSVRIRNSLEMLRLEGKSEQFEELFVAARHVEETAGAYRDTVSLFAGYALPTVASAIASDAELRNRYAHLSEILQTPPSIEGLALQEVRKRIEDAGMEEAITLSAIPAPEKDHARAWYGDVMKRLGEAEEAAKGIYASLLNVALEARRYFDEMDFTFLYNKERGLFHVGFNATNERLDDAYYDLLASEANSASIVGIAKRDVPTKHWSFLGRKLVKSAAGDTLVASWAGSLFEYLGTLIYFDVPRGSFWGVSAQRAIAAHRAFAKRYGVPWGMGESASSLMDPAHNYHYQAFGEPSLGWKRDLSSSVVVAPYTSALALPFAPAAAIENFRTLTREGAFGRYGFYDAIDYTNSRKEGRREGVPARIFYAHHQGFILASIANTLLPGWVRARVLEEPDMAVATQLFEEKMPEAEAEMTLTAPASSLTRLALPAKEESSPRHYIPVRAREAQFRFLSAGRFATEITASGAGMSRYENVNVTRASIDPLKESQGTFFYLRDEEGEVWSPTFMPTRTAGERSNILAGEEVIEFDKQHQGIETRLTVASLAGYAGEARNLKIVNHRDAETELVIGLCADVSLSRLQDEASHHNYERLFVASEIALDGRAVVAWRPDPRDRNREIAAGFLVTADRELSEFRAMRDREQFYGSPVDLTAPPVLSELTRADEERPKHTLDTSAGFVMKIKLRPKEEANIALVMNAGATKENVTESLRHFRNHRIVAKMLGGIDRAGGALLTRLGISATQANTFAAFASYAFARFRGTRPAPKEAGPMVNLLWRHAISGVRPIVALHISGITDIPLVRQMILCHSYFLAKGINADIVIFNDHSGGYLKTLEDEIDFLLRLHRDENPLAGSEIFHVHAEQMTEAEREAFLATVALHIDARKGSLVDAAAALARVPRAKFPPPFKASTKRRRNGAPSGKHKYEKRKLEHENGFGGFDPETGAYLIRTNGRTRPPRPWSNIIANDHIGTLATDRGNAFTWARNSYDNRLTVSYNDPLSSESSEAFYVRDEETGEYWSPLVLAGDPKAEYEIAHAEGYTEWRTMQGGLELALRMHVPLEEPIKYITATVKNTGDRDRELRAFGYFELLLGATPFETNKHLAFEIREGNILVAENRYRNNFPESRAFLGVAGGADSFSLSRDEFLGNGDLSSPSALSREDLSSQPEIFGEPAASLSKRFSLKKGETRSIVFFLGEAGNDASLAHFIAELTSEEHAKRTFEEVRRYWKELSPLSVDLPDTSLALLTNRWLPYQTLASRIRARLGFFQIGGAYGFRDQLQDAMALFWFDPKWARAHILAAAAHQFREGDVLSWWHPHNDFGSRTRLSDQHLWLPYVALRYVRATGDAALWEEDVTYLEGDLPDIAERPSVTGVFSTKGEHSSLYEHCVRALERSLTAGPHGLPLMGAADWNDGMNRVGNEGRGESVWLAWFTISVLLDMASLAKERGDADRAKRYQDHAEAYRTAIGKFGWDGKWYRRAYTDLGVPVGSANAKAFRIDSVSQSWAMFVNGATKETLEALRSAKTELSILDGHVPLAWPPLSRDILDLGTISDYPEGVRENAAQYNHAALWLGQALALALDADAAKVVLDAVNPIKRSATHEDAIRYRGEPYAVSADVYSAPTYQGRAGWTWYTASAGVMYRTVIEYILGLTREGERLTVTPAFPSGWNEATVRLRSGDSTWIIRYEREEGRAERALVVDGTPVSGDTFTLLDDGKEHTVKVFLPSLKAA